MDGLPCRGQTSELLHVSMQRQTQIVLITSYSIVLDTSSSTQRRCLSNSVFLLNSAASLFNLLLILRVQFCSESAQLRQWVCSILQGACSTSSAGPVIFAYLQCEKSLPSMGHFILHTPWRVPLFFTMHYVQERPLYPVLSVFSTLSTLELWKCIALLCNSEILYRILILWLYNA